MNGPELAEKLTASQPGVKVIYMSGYTGELMAERAVLQRGITLIEKPFARNALLKAIEEALG
jgi:two-component system, cell cycle sensor histidine kinase and response regulator CckA